MKNLAKKRTVVAKERRTQLKKARAQEQQERKLWSQRQRFEHTHDGDDDCSSEDDSPSTYQKCKCGSADYKSIQHHSCPLNNSWQNLIDNTVGDEDTDMNHEEDYNNEEDMDYSVHVAQQGLAIIVNPSNMKYK